jgi:hypothetical protein
MVLLRKPLRKRMDRHGGPVFGALEENDVDVMAPRAIKMLDSKTQNKLIKESGFSQSHIKRVWGL